MDDVSLYERILALQSPWFVDAVELDEDQQVVNVYVAIDEGERLPCPVCGTHSPRYDHRQRRWRHLDTCQYPTHVISDVPRIECSDHGILTIEIPWAEQRSRFTLMFEAHLIDWLLESSVSAVARMFGLSWNAVDGVMQRAVSRGLKRRRRTAFKGLCVDEVAIKKGHDYVTVVSNPKGHVQAVEEGRTKESLRGFYSTLTDSQKRALQWVSMDMSGAYISVTLEEIPLAEQKIAFDKFHVAMAIHEAVDQVRKQERRELIRTLHYDAIKGQRFLWLKRPENLLAEEKGRLQSLQRIARKTGRAWVLKEMASQIWRYRSRGWAQKGWTQWCGRANRSRLTPMKAVAQSIKKNLWGIVNAMAHGVNNAMAESINAKIKLLKVRSRGFRNRERFRTMILFYYGGLKLYP